MGWWDSLLSIFGFQSSLKRHHSVEDISEDQPSDDHLCSVQAVKRFKHNYYPSFGNSNLESIYVSSDNMSPKQFFTSRKKVPPPKKLPPVVQINETDDDDDDIKVLSSSTNVTQLNSSAQGSQSNSLARNSARHNRSPSSNKANHKTNDRHNGEEIQVISSSSDDIQIDEILAPSPCSSRINIKTKPEVYSVDDDDQSNNKENEDDEVEVIDSPIARRMQIHSMVPCWSTAAHVAPRRGASSFLFKKRNPHERQTTLQQIQKLQSREDYARLLQAISSLSSNSSTRDNTIAPSSSRNSPTPTGSELDALDRLSSAPLSIISHQSRPPSHQSRHISISKDNKTSYVDVGRPVDDRATSSTNKFRYLNPAPQSVQSRIPVSKMSSTSQNKEDRLDAMIRSIQSIDLRRFDANISRQGLAVARTNDKVKALEIPSYDVLLEKTINLRKVPEKLQPKKKEEPKLPVIDEELEYFVRRVRSLQPDHVVSKIGLEEITRDQFLSLEGLTWLKDNVINCYMALIAERSKKSEGKMPNVYGFNTFFHTALSDHGYTRVKRWTKKVDLFSHDILFVPIHVQKIHWCLATIDFRNKCVTYYDSMAGGDRGVNQRLLKYLADESMDKKKVPFDVSSWSTRSPKDIPQQMNSCDCGVFTSTFAEYLARDGDIQRVKQEDMPYYRRKMMFEILTRTLTT